MVYSYNIVQKELFWPTWPKGLGSHIYYRNDFRYFDYGGVYYDNENTPMSMKGWPIDMKRT